MPVERALLAAVWDGFGVVDVVDAEPVDDEAAEEPLFEAELVAAAKDGGEDDDDDDDGEPGVDDEVILAAWIALSWAGVNLPVMPVTLIDKRANQGR